MGPNATMMAQTTSARMQTATGGTRNRTSSMDPFDLVKPSLLERKAVDQSSFMNLSTGFQKVFGSDDRDKKKLVLPIAGYGGHRRGDKCQNFFGKTFREHALQSKQLERNFRSHSLMG